jgi:hypothetical protein
MPSSQPAFLVDARPHGTSLERRSCQSVSRRKCAYRSSENPQRRGSLSVRAIFTGSALWVCAFTSDRQFSSMVEFPNAHVMESDISREKETASIARGRFFG